MGISGVLFLLCQFTGISSLVVYMTSVFKVLIYIDVKYDANVNTGEFIARFRTPA